MDEVGLIERGSITFFSEVVLGRQSRRGKHYQGSVCGVSTCVPEIVATNTTACGDLLAFDDFRVAPALLWRKTTQ